MYQLIVVNIKVGLHAKISLSYHTYCKVNVPFLINQRALRVPFLIAQRALKVPLFYKVTVPFFVPGVNTMCGRRKLDKLLDTFQSFNLNIGVTQSKRYVTFYCILFFKNHLSF